MIPESQLAEWQRMAEAATPGKWDVEHSLDRDHTDVVYARYLNGEPDWVATVGRSELDQQHADSIYIAIGPDNFLALIADLRDARKECQYRAKLIEQSVSVISDATDAEQTVRAENERLRAELQKWATHGIRNVDHNPTRLGYLSNSAAGKCDDWWWEYFRSASEIQQQLARDALEAKP
jgi:hypothetical protein